MRKRESKVGITTVLIGAFALSLLLGILCALPFAETGASLGNVTFLYFLLAMGATLLLLSLMSTLRRNRSTNKNEVRASILIPLGIVALAVGIALILQPHFPPLINAIGRLSMELSLIVGFLLAARYISSDPVQTSALGQAAFLIGNSLGVMIGLQLPNLFALHVDHLLVISIVITLVTSEALFVLAVLYQFACRSSTSSTASLKDTELQEGVAAKAKEPESSSVLDAFASHYALSNKESETLRLTVRGRSRQRIAEMLYVSPGTVNTYFYRIYQKTGVHTRQELLDLVEGFATARENNGTARNPQPADRANTETANY